MVTLSLTQRHDIAAKAFPESLPPQKGQRSTDFKLLITCPSLSEVICEAIFVTFTCYAPIKRLSNIILQVATQVAYCTSDFEDPKAARGTYHELNQPTKGLCRGNSYMVPQAQHSKFGTRQRKCLTF